MKKTRRALKSNTAGFFKKVADLSNPHCVIRSICINILLFQKHFFRNVFANVPDFFKALKTTKSQNATMTVFLFNYFCIVLHILLIDSLIYPFFSSRERCVLCYSFPPVHNAF
ncbi:hypothetical protein JCM6292_3656 [Bacteroides pyogenes JCM 6292]|uniref:Uncharacterized protein n=2 Tax=Bacteroides pyogenes TaxID=310300 RepID=W4PBK6_9BACE|nr:hypothetical protein JCM6292_3656 [Bacteroides pyogenes JCM 6292]